MYVHVCLTPCSPHNASHLTRAPKCERQSALTKRHSYIPIKKKFNASQNFPSNTVESTIFLPPESCHKIHVAAFIKQETDQVNFSPQPPVIPQLGTLCLPRSSPWDPSSLSAHWTASKDQFMLQSPPLGPSTAHIPLSQDFTPPILITVNP